MDPDQLAFKLREFYLLEIYQLKLFSHQVNSLPDAYSTYAHERMVELEQRHVDYFAEKMLEKGIAKPEIADDSFSFAGFVSAKALDLFSLEERYKLGMAVETKAAEMYLELINEVQDDQEFVRMLWHNHTDEEFHKFWFRANLEKLHLEAELQRV